MARVGGLTSRFYRETKGIKVTGGQRIRAGTLLTREGGRWKPGANVTGRMHLSALCDGEVYFTKKKGKYRNRVVTYVNIRPIEKKVKKKTSKP
jgi:ribosomal protein L27